MSNACGYESREAKLREERLRAEADAEYCKTPCPRCGTAAKPIENEDRTVYPYCPECGCIRESDRVSEIYREFKGDGNLRLSMEDFELMLMEVVRLREMKERPTFERDHAAAYWLEAVAGDAISEAKRGRSLYGPYNTPHEAFAVLKEEVDELWDEVKAEDPLSNLEAIGNEALQVAAVALRIAVSCRRSR